MLVSGLFFSNRFVLWANWGAGSVQCLFVLHFWPSWKNSLIVVKWSVILAPRTDRVSRNIPNSVPSKYELFVNILFDLRRSGQIFLLLEKIYVCIITSPWSVNIITMKNCSYLHYKPIIINSYILRDPGFCSLKHSINFFRNCVVFWFG